MWTLITLYATLWIVFHLGSGYVAHRLPLHLLVALPVIGSSYTWEEKGKFYAWLWIRRWKDALPEAGGFFRGGFCKRHLHGTDANDLDRFAQETCRAEYSHWLTWSMALTFFAWNPWQIGVVMLIYGAVTNAPFILVQRYNRARLRRILSTLDRRAHRNQASLPAHAVTDEREIE